MPELPEVEHVKRGIQPFIEGETIERVVFSDKVAEGKAAGRETIIKGITLDGFKQYSEGYIIERVARLSKYITFNIRKADEERILVSHLGMAGGFFIVSQLEDISVPNYRKHWHVIFELSNGMKLVYSDIRRFGEIRNISDYDAYPSLLEIAPDPFDDAAYPHYLESFNQKFYQNKPVKQFILDHRVVAGCGNIYTCEALFESGIDPSRLVKDLTQEERDRLFQHVRNVLEKGIKYGGTSISDYRHADGAAGTMQLHLNVYKQKVRHNCGSSIETKIVAGRNSHYCPACQR